MPIIRPELINNEFYHIVLRGTGDSIIFQDKNDYFRAIFSLYEFNNNAPITIRERRKLRKENRKANREQFSVNRELLVEIFAFCLMPNHIHLLLKQVQEDGITKFMRKLGAGYAGYFNRKYDRKGHLFQGRFKAVYIKDDEQLKNVFVYIHANPISLIEPKWKERGISNVREVIRFLENYKWSSYIDYIGKKGFPSITERGFILDIFQGMNNCKDFVEKWAEYHGTIQTLGDIALE